MMYVSAALLLGVVYVVRSAPLPSEASMEELRASIEAFECFPAEEQKKNYFANANYVNEIPEGVLPQVRLLMCGYESQCALQFAAYLYMREKLGMNVTFYPTLDYDSVWHSVHWNVTQTGGAGYPRKYFEWLADDEGDLQFEIWQTQMMRTDANGEETFNGESEFILTGEVDFGGFVGAYAEESVWVPSYVLTDDADFFVPTSMRDNSDYRERLIAAAMGQYENASADATDFVKKYENATDFDVPTYDTPTVWTSLAYYFGSHYSHDLISTPPNDLDMNFVATGSESSLMTMITELYAARQPLLAYMYTLDVNFGRVDMATGELQQFEKLAYPRNPDQSANDPCFEAKECQFPVAPIMKLANPLLRDRFPEAYDFFNLFKMTTSQVNLLVSKYLTLSDSPLHATMPSTQKWLHAACEWMKDEKSASTWATGAWEVPITRYDCIEGCGFDGIGGDCDYYSGECQCWTPELFADEHCRASCPGLVDPVLNESGEWEFGFCSGHGVCDVTSRQCSCDESWEGDNCATSSSLTTHSTLHPTTALDSAIIEPTAAPTAAAVVTESAQMCFEERENLLLQLKAHYVILAVLLLILFVFICRDVFIGCCRPRESPQYIQVGKRVVQPHQPPIVLHADP